MDSPRLSVLCALADLCWRHPSNRLIAVESEVVHTLMGLLALLHPTGAARVGGTRTAAASPLAVELQRAALHPFTHLDRFVLAKIWARPRLLDSKARLLKRWPARRRLRP